MKNRAFTLIELLIVVAIIGLLIGISVAFLGDAKKSGTDVSKIRALSETRNALNVYFNDTLGGNGTYPSGTELDLTILVTKKYINEINTNIKYQGMNVSGTPCNLPALGCASYHLAVSLKANNSILKTDSDTNTSGVINGTLDNCVSGTASNPDLCYDVTP